jgi:hypothetical protein
MAVSLAEFRVAQGYFFDLEIAGTNLSSEVTAIVVPIRGIVGSKNAGRRNLRMNYRMLADVSDLHSELPEGWIVSPQPSQIEHINIWPPDKFCPLTRARTPRICWGSGPSAWRQANQADRTLGNFLEVATTVLNGANLLSPAR